MKLTEHSKTELDKRDISDEDIHWSEIKVGDVVVECITDIKYRVLTNVNGTYWEYFDPTDGYYHATSPEFCAFKVDGQKSANGKLIPIIVDGTSLG